MCDAGCTFPRGPSLTRLCLTLQKSSLAGFPGDMGDSRLICLGCRCRLFFKVAWTTPLSLMWGRPGRNRTLSPWPLSPHRLLGTLFRWRWFPLSSRIRRRPRWFEQFRDRRWDLSLIYRTPGLIMGVVTLRVGSRAGAWLGRAPSLQKDRHHLFVLLAPDAPFGIRHIVPRTMSRPLASLSKPSPVPGVDWHSRVGWSVRNRDRGGGYMRCRGIRLWMQMYSCTGMFA